MNNVIYEKLDMTQWREVWIVGDLHGHKTKLMAALDEVGFDFSQDLLISTGDLIDRGPDNIDTLALITLGWFRCVRGNHEQMAYEAVIGGNRGAFSCWMDNGGRWYLPLDAEQELEAKSLLRRVPSLPHVLELSGRDETIVVCHADYPGKHYKYGSDVREDEVIWGRNRINSIMSGKSCPITGADRFFFGHTALKCHTTSGNLHYIDTGCGLGRAPTLYRIQEAS